MQVSNEEVYPAASEGHFPASETNLPANPAHFPAPLGHFPPSRGHFAASRAHFPASLNHVTASQKQQEALENLPGKPRPKKSVQETKLFRWGTFPEPKFPGPRGIWEGCEASPAEGFDILAHLQ